MIDIDSRPDLTSLIIQTSKYNAIYTEDDQIIIAIDGFKWYGIALNCMNTEKISTYLVENKYAKGTVYLKTYYNTFDLDTIIKESIAEASICKKCGSTEAEVVIGPNIICKNCASKIRNII